MTHDARAHRGLVPVDPSPAIPPLSPGAVHIWRLPAADAPGRIAAARAVLDADEAVRAERIRGAAADTFTVTRGALRHVLARYLDTSPAALRFEYGPTGKPRLAAARAAGIAFSVTHADRLSLVAVAATRRVGIDAERLQPRARATRVARRVFAPATCSLLERLHGDERVLAFYHAWTLREAHVKALGSGVFSSLDTLPLDWPTGVAPRIREEVTREGARRHWTVVALQPAAGCIATLVAEGSVTTPRVLEAGALLDARADPR